MTIQELTEKGFMCGSRHIRCLGRVKLPGDGNWENTPDICGWYENFGGGFTAFVTDSGHRAVESKIRYSTEKEAIEGLIRFAERENFKAMQHSMLDDFDRLKPMLLSWLKKECGYDGRKADDVLSGLMRKEVIAFEFAYYVQNMRFVPDKFALWVKGWTAEKLHRTMGYAIPEAFDYMVRLSRDRELALKDIPKLSRK